MKKKHISYPLVAITVLITVLCAPNVARPVPVELDLEILGGDTGQTQGYATICTDIDWDDVLANPDEEYTWWMQNPLTITAQNDSSQILAVLDGVSVVIKGDPVIELGFAVTAGDYDTAFSFSSPVFTFDPMVNPEARALASVTVGPDDTLIGAYNYEAYRSCLLYTSPSPRDRS